MRILIGAALALAFASTAFAQTGEAPAAPTVAANSQCAAVGPEPTLPEAATATAETIQAGNAAYQAWATAAQESLRCRQAEIQQGQARLAAMTEEHNGIVRRVNGLTQTWTATAEAYCARDGVRCSQNR
ncbi:MAG: hypothetical protein NW206_04470 [Hyphomonadaceae bacterium]|nr:hypothetical protein [Hyphomonadaceae bacterium]